MTSHLELLAILSSAVLIVWLFRRLQLPAILAYLVAGVLVGEHGLALAQEHVDYEHFAELSCFCYLPSGLNSHYLNYWPCGI